MMARPDAAPSAVVTVYASSAGSPTASADARPKVVLDASLLNPSLWDWVPSFLRRSAPAAPPAAASRRPSTASKSGGRSVSVVPFDLETVIRGEVRAAPWRPEILLSFLEAERNEEHLQFWAEVEALKRGTEAEGGAAPVKETLLLTSPQDRADPLRHTERIVDMFVAPTAEHAINVSAAQRDRALEAARRSIEERRPSPVAFDETQREALHLLRDDAYPRFVRSVLTHNLGDRASTRRVRVGAALSALTVAATVAMIAVTQVPAAALAALLPLWFAVVDMVVSGRTRVCAISATLGQASTARGMHFAVSCPLTKRALRKRARAQVVVELVMAAAVTGVMIGVAAAVRA